MKTIAESIKFMAELGLFHCEILMQNILIMKDSVSG